MEVSRCPFYSQILPYVVFSEISPRGVHNWSMWSIIQVDKYKNVAFG